MMKEKAVEYARKKLGYDPENEYMSLVRLRQNALLLPLYGVDGSRRDLAEWAYLDMSEKVDTGMYGAVYYF